MLQDDPSQSRPTIELDMQSSATPAQSQVTVASSNISASELLPAHLLMRLGKNTKWSLYLKEANSKRKFPLRHAREPKANRLTSTTKNISREINAMVATIQIPGLRAAVATASEIMAITKTMNKNHSDCEEMLHRTLTLMLALATPFSGQGAHHLDRATEEKIQRLTNILSEIVDDLRALKADTEIRAFSQVVKVILDDVAVRERLAACSEKLNLALTVFQSDIIQLQRHLELGNEMQQLGNEMRSGAKLIMGNYLEENLRPAEARHNSFARGRGSNCLEGTCLDIIQNIRKWIVSTDGTQLRFFWLYGLAGTGKSTIARTASEYFAASGNLGATFFFSQDQADRADGRHVFSTIAYQLAYVMSSFQARLIEAIKADPEARSSDLSTQLQKLIIKPLHGVVDAPSPLVIVLDALDECEDPIDAREIITLLANATVQFPPYLHLKILITSRPEVHLYPPSPRWISLVTSVVANLHDVKEPDVKADIKIYLRDRLLGEDEVATDEEIDRLVEMAQGAFFVASSAVQFIDNSYSQSLLGRKKQLQIILATESSYRNPNLLTLEVPQPRGPPPYRALDVMYSNILSKALPAEHDSDFEEHLRSVLGSVILLFDLLSTKSFETLLRLEPHTITETLARLRSVIVVPENDQDSSSLRIIHPSFVAFLTTSYRCTNPRLFIDPVPLHLQIVLSCLSHMSESLGRDMCDIGSLPALNSDVLDLPTCLDRSIPSYLRYACRYWPAHLVSAKLVPDSNKYLSEQVIHQLASVVEKFVSTKLLCWLEVLSLLGSLDAAVPLLKLVEQGLAGMANLVEDTLAVIGDAQRLVTQFFDPMSASTATIYSSALPSMVNCRLYNIYQHELDGSVVV
ncbi:hypothetical protein FRB96_005555 [Tulasnella sp. 330]|nr:hypothetical protein FRB96_005555 [Tulasnella sp. 330]